MVLEKVINRINASVAANAAADGVDTRAMVIVVMLYIVCVVSMPLDDPSRLLWLFCFPIITSEATGMGYGCLFVRSLWILPVVALIGAFNPVFDRQVVWHVCGVSVTRGWLTLVSLMLRGLLAMQALLLLIWQSGFFDICRCLRVLRVPGVLVTQLLLLYRYIGVLLTETLSIQRAVQSRGYGKKSFPLRMWGVMAGQLLVRSIARARRVDAAMKARGFTGVMYFKPFAHGLRLADIAFMVVWIVVFCAMRFVNLSAIAATLITH